MLLTNSIRNALFSDFIIYHLLLLFPCVIILSILIPLPRVELGKSRFWNEHVCHSVKGAWCAQEDLNFHAVGTRIPLWLPILCRTRLLFPPWALSTPRGTRTLKTSSLKRVRIPIFRHRCLSVGNGSRTHKLLSHLLLRQASVPFEYTHIMLSVGLEPTRSFLQGFLRPQRSA